jgi:hypothetical protein
MLMETPGTKVVSVKLDGTNDHIKLQEKINEICSQGYTYIKSTPGVNDFMILEFEKVLQSNEKELLHD